MRSLAGTAERVKGNFASASVRGGALRSLKRKAGLPESWWGPEARLSVYTVEKYVEEDEEGP